MLFVALTEAADKGELVLVNGGMCRFHRRRDGVVTIREILVLPGFRRLGIGRRMVEHIIQTCPASPVVARCPIEYESNKFWDAMGFRLDSGEKVNLWRWECGSSSALTATRPTSG